MQRMLACRLPGLTTIKPITTALLFLLIGSTVSLTTSAHENPGYYRGSDGFGSKFADWMKQVPNSVQFNMLTLPGTHDSAAYSWGGETTETQSMNISTQLNSGIRVFDIRFGTGNLAHCTGDIYLWHGDTCMFTKFSSEVLAPIGSFLAQNPSEAVVLKLQPATGNNVDASVLGPMLRRQLIASKINFYNGGSRNPSLGDLRGKVLIMAAYMGSIGTPDGEQEVIDYISDLATIKFWNNKHEWTDDWSCTTNWSLASGWRSKKNRFNTVNSSTDASTFYVISLTGSGGCFPYFVASGHSSWQTSAPRLLTGMTRGTINTCRGSSNCIAEFPSVNCFLGTCSVAFEGLNTLTMQYLAENIHKRAGIVMADFPGAGLVRAIVQVNLDAIERPPLVKLQGIADIVEGGSLNLGIYIDPQDSDTTHKLEVDWGGTCEGSKDQQKACEVTRKPVYGGKQSLTLKHQYLDDPDESLAAAPPPAKAIDMVTVTVSVMDDTTTTVVRRDLWVRNVPPKLTTSGNYKMASPTSPEISLKFAIFDPGVKDTFTLHVNWGDGSPEQQFTYKDQKVTTYPTHRYPANKNYTAQLRLVDDDGGAASATVNIIAAQ